MLDFLFTQHSSQKWKQHMCHNLEIDFLTSTLCYYFVGVQMTNERLGGLSRSGMNTNRDVGKDMGRDMGRDDDRYDNPNESYDNPTRSGINVNRDDNKMAPNGRYGMQNSRLTNGRYANPTRSGMNLNRDDEKMAPNGRYGNPTRSVMDMGRDNDRYGNPSRSGMNRWDDGYDLLTMTPEENQDTSLLCAGPEVS